MNKIQGKITTAPKITGSVKTSMIYPTLEDLKVKSSSEEQEFKPKAYGFNNVIVEPVVELQGDTLTVSPSTSTQKIVPESPANGFTEVNVNAVTADIDSNIVPENIANGIEILGVKGNLKGKPSINLFVQETEPETKDGIWVKDNYEVENITAKKSMFSTGVWDTTRPKSMPMNGSDHGAVLVGRYIYIFGLRNTGSTNVGAYKYDTLTDTYTQIANVPVNFLAGGCSAVGTNIYLFGGTSNPTTAYKYDTLTDTYTKLTDIPFNFKYGRCATVGNYIYLFGSVYSTATMKYAYRYNVVSGIYGKLTDIPYQFTSGGCVAYGTDIYLFGTSRSSYYKTAYKYDTVTKVYAQIKDVPYDFYNGNAVSVGNYIYLFSGSGGETKAYRYIPSSNAYYSVTDIPYGATSSAIVFDGSKIYLFGGTAYGAVVQGLNITSMDTILNKTLIINQDVPTNQANNLIEDSIDGVQTHYNKVYYKNENGRVVTPIVYNGNGTNWAGI